MRLARWDPFKTTLTRWDPFREFDDLTERMNRLMTRPAWGAEEALVTADWAPIVDIQESDKEYLVKAELPEVKKEDVKVNIKEGVLTLEGERKQEKEEKGKKFHKIEREYGKFVRRFALPTEIDASVCYIDEEDLRISHIGMYTRRLQ
jgi:HSP20 family protein